MSEPLVVKLDDGTGEAFDRTLRGSFPQEAAPGMDTAYILTKRATPDQPTVVAVHFNSVVWDQSIENPGPEHRKTVPVVTCMTAKQFLMAAVALIGGHPETKAMFESMSDMSIPDIPEDAIIEGDHNGVPYVARAFVGYLVQVEGVEGVSLADSKDTVPALVKQIVEGGIE